jgi:hypothetical protein
VEAFDKKTDFQAYAIGLPHGCDEQIKTIMGWTTEQQGWEGYDLTHVQLSALETLTGKPLQNPLYYFQLTGNG